MIRVLSDGDWVSIAMLEETNLEGDHVSIEMHRDGRMTCGHFYSNPDEWDDHKELSEEQVKALFDAIREVFNEM